MAVHFKLFERPRGKERPRFDRKSGRVYTPKSTAEAEEAIRERYWRATNQKPLTGPVKLTVIAIFEIPKSWNKALVQAAKEGKVWHVAKGQLDLDNAVKLVADALNGVAYHDDAQIAVITSGKRYGAPQRLEVTISPLDQPEIPATPGQKRLEKKVNTRSWGNLLNRPPARRR